LADQYQEAMGLQLTPKVRTKERALYDQFLMVIFTDLESCGRIENLLISRFIPET
jgi:hypothetical protein